MTLVIDSDESTLDPASEDLFAFEFDLSRIILDGREILFKASRSPLVRLSFLLMRLDPLAELRLLPLSLPLLSARDLLDLATVFPDFIGLNSSPGSPADCYFNSVFLTVGLG